MDKNGFRIPPPCKYFSSPFNESLNVPTANATSGFEITKPFNTKIFFIS